MFVLLMWVMALLPLAIIVMVLGAVNMGKFGELPTFEELENPNRSLASEVITRDNNL